MQIASLFTLFGGTMSGFQLLASTGTAGYTLVNGTGTIISWTAPDDGNMHRIVFISILDVTSTQTGGQIRLTYTLPGGESTFANPYPGGSAVAVIANNQLGATGLIPIGPGTEVTLLQNSAQSAGAAILWAELWGS